MASEPIERVPNSIDSAAAPTTVSNVAPELVTMTMLLVVTRIPRIVYPKDRFLQAPQRPIRVGFKLPV